MQLLHLPYAATTGKSLLHQIPNHQRYLGLQACQETRSLSQLKVVLYTESLKTGITSEGALCVAQLGENHTIYVEHRGNASEEKHVFFFLIVDLPSHITQEVIMFNLEICWQDSHFSYMMPAQKTWKCFFFNCHLYSVSVNSFNKKSRQMSRHKSHTNKQSHNFAPSRGMGYAIVWFIHKSY